MCCSKMLGHLLISILICSSLTDITHAVSYLGYPAIPRPNDDHVHNTLLLVDPSHAATHNGTLMAWSIYILPSRIKELLHLQIWRRMSDRAPRYQLVGQTDIVALWPEESFIPLKPGDRIPIERGDVLGLFFPGRNPIPWTATECRDDDLNMHLFKYNPRRYLSTKTVRFDKPLPDWKPCRKYSFNATIMEETELLEWDEDYERTRDHRYQHRPYGKNITSDPRWSKADSFSGSSYIVSVGLLWSAWSQTTSCWI